MTPPFEGASPGAPHPPRQSRFRAGPAPARSPGEGASRLQILRAPPRSRRCCSGLSFFSGVLAGPRRHDAPMTASSPPFWTEPLEPGPGLDEEALRADFVRKLNYELAKFQPISTRNDHYLALAHVVRERLLHHWVHSARTYLEGRNRTVSFLSAEYLIGPQLGLNLMNLKI